MKRLFDVSVALLALVVLAPLLAAIALAVRREDRGPVLFRQVRIGRGGRPFEILKYRTMRSEAGGAPITVRGDPRLTRIGQRLRRWKLDELPQLWNVLRGDMSLVGPRPEVPQYVDLGSPLQREVLRVRPGMTGWAQLDGLDEEAELAGVPDPERLYREVLLPRKLALDLRYVREGSFATDLAILARTAVCLWQRGRDSDDAPPG
jgi:lipopolysaccharide/colanic/teichoic acid biosynthesis glycosyltransferase